MGLSQDQLKKQVAEAAIEYVQSGIIGVGTGSTANFFIDALGEIKNKIEGAVASSKSTAERLESHGIEVFDLNSVNNIEIYVDGADEANEFLHLIKGGGAALTREKIIAAASKEFVCIADESKLVPILGKFPLPVEVIPMSRSFVGREIVKLGGDPVYREGCVTDNGNHIIDIFNLVIDHPTEMEQLLNQITGVVTNGLFANRRADRLFLGTTSGVKIITP